MKQVSGDVLVERDGKLRAFVSIDGIEVNHMRFGCDDMKKANRWLSDAKQLELERLRQMAKRSA